MAGFVQGQEARNRPPEAEEVGSPSWSLQSISHDRQGPEARELQTVQTQSPGPWLELQKLSELSGDTLNADGASPAAYALVQCLGHRLSSGPSPWEA